MTHRLHIRFNENNFLCKLGLLEQNGKKGVTARTGDGYKKGQVSLSIKSSGRDNEQKGRPKSNSFKAALLIDALEKTIGLYLTSTGYNL